MLSPQLQAIALIGSRVSIAEAKLVVGEDVEPLCQIGDGELPVSPGRDTRSRAVNEDHWRSTTRLVIVRLDSASLNRFADFRRCFCLCHRFLSLSRAVL